MPFNTTECYLTFEARRLLGDNPSLCQLCNFKFEVSDLFLEWLKKKSSKFKFVRKDIIDEILKRNRVERLPMLAEYWKTIGFQPPRILESNTKNGASIVDFNLSLVDDFGINEQFDCINNCGVGEHVFDQTAVYSNIHNLCKVGGLMTHRVPMFGVLNITLYGITPRFFWDLAKANRYKIESFWITNRWGDVIEVISDDIPAASVFRNELPKVPGCSRSLGWEGPEDRKTLSEKRTPEHLKLPKNLDFHTAISKAASTNPNNPLSDACNRLVNRGDHFRPGNCGEIYSMVILRKMHEEPFRVPYQGNNLEEIEDPVMRERYRYQFDDAK
jgi:hypothetical protein